MAYAGLAAIRGSVLVSVSQAGRLGTISDVDKGGPVHIELHSQAADRGTTVKRIRDVLPVNR